MDLTGRIVLLTGGSRGLGPVIAEALARRGAHLALAARSEEGLRQTRAALAPYGVRTLAVPVDLSAEEDRRRLVDRVMEEFGAIDVLVNNAGLEPEGGFLDQPWEEIRATIEVNFAAPVHLTRLVLPQMLERARGHVVQVSSLAGKVGTPYDAIYSGTKAALARWSEGLRRELGEEGVGVSVVFPGYVTGEGMFARSGMKPPRLVGSSTPAQVAAGVLSAIEDERAEVLVNSMPMRPLLALGELFPGLTDRLLVRLGVADLQRRKSVPPPPTASG